MQTGSGAHPASYTPDVQRPEREAAHTPSSNAEIKYSYTSIPPIRVHGFDIKQKHKFTCTFIDF
jgi:hypothetical protein